MVKKYSYKNIRAKVYKQVKEACYAPTNMFTANAWDFHILPVVEHSLELGKRLKADPEILELASLLHDYAGILNVDLYEKHHIHGSHMAGEILGGLGYPADKIERVKKCILNHRGSVRSARPSLEEKIVASADAMSHITELADMLYLVFGVHKLKTVEGVTWLKNKFERSWRKIIPEGKLLVAGDYEIANSIFNKALRRRK